MTTKVTKKSNITTPHHQFLLAAASKFAQTCADLLSEWRVKSNFVEPWLRFGKLEQARSALTLHKV